MNQTKELRMSTKGILSLALLLVTVIFVMQKSTLVQASSATQKVEKNGVYYTFLDENQFKKCYTMDSEENYSYYLQPEKYNDVLSKIKEKGGIYAVMNGYKGTNPTVSIENEIDGMPVMIVSFYYDEVVNDDDVDSNEITAISIPANVVDFDLGEYGEINIDQNNRYFTVKDGVLYNKALTEILCYFNTKVMNGVYNVPENITKLESYPADVEIINLSSNVVSLPEHDASETLTAINVVEGNKKYSSLNGVLYNKDKTTLMFYPMSKKDKTYKMPNTVKDISECVLMRQKYLEELVISDKVTVIPSYFADGAKNLKSVHLPKKLKKIEGWAFEDCTKLKKVTVPSACNSMNRAFSGCKTTITIKSKKIRLYLDVANNDNKKNTFVIKKGTQITCYTNAQSGIKSKTNSILSIKKKGKYGTDYTIKVLKTGKTTVKCYRDKLNFKVVK